MFGMVHNTLKIHFLDRHQFARFLFRHCHYEHFLLWIFVSLFYFQAIFSQWVFDFPQKLYLDLERQIQKTDQFLTFYYTFSFPHEYTTQFPLCQAWPYASTTRLVSPSNHGTGASTTFGTSASAEQA
jgi:hypothetical protein